VALGVQHRPVAHDEFALSIAGAPEQVKIARAGVHERRIQTQRLLSFPVAALNAPTGPGTVVEMYLMGAWLVEFQNTCSPT